MGMGTGHVQRSNQCRFECVLNVLRIEDPPSRARRRPRTSPSPRAAPPLRRSHPAAGALACSAQHIVPPFRFQLNRHHLRRHRLRGPGRKPGASSYTLTRLSLSLSLSLAATAAATATAIVPFLPQLSCHLPAATLRLLGFPRSPPQAGAVQVDPRLTH